MILIILTVECTIGCRSGFNSCNISRNNKRTDVFLFNKKMWNSRHSKVKKGTKLQNIKALWLEVFLSGASLDELGGNDERKSWYGCSVTAEKIKEKKEFEITASTSPWLVFKRQAL